MPAELIDGKAIAATIRGEVAAEVAQLAARGMVPGLTVVLVGDDVASATYVGAKEKASREVGMRGETIRLPATTTQVELLALVERLARPGVRCRDVYAEVHEWLNACPVGSWSSHLGHGIGLAVHEPPHLNPSWDDVLEEGDVIAVEPALYDPVLAAGLRIENDYLVTATGVENLSPFPLDLA